MKFFFLLLIIIIFGCSRDWSNPNDPETKEDVKIPADGLVAWYPFNGNADDESGNGNNGTINGAILTKDRFDKNNSAYSFNGTSDYINIGNNIKPDFPLTVSVWIKANEFVNDAGIFRNDQVNDASYRYGILLVCNSNGSLGAHVFEGFSASSNRRSTASQANSAEIDVWYHFTAVFYSYANTEIFINSVKSITSTSGTGSSMKYSSNNGAIGDRSGKYYFNGIIDDIRVYNRALTKEEIQVLYHEGGWGD